MADLKENDLVKVTGSRKLCGTELPLWCNGQTGKVLRTTVDSRVVVKLDGSSAKELIFLADELEPVNAGG